LLFFEKKTRRNTWRLLRACGLNVSHKQKSAMSTLQLRGTDFQVKVYKAAMSIPRVRRRRRRKAAR